MEYNPQLILAIFEHFLKNPKPVSEDVKHKDGSYVYNRVGDLYCPPGYDFTDPVVRWHVVAFVRECIWDVKSLNEFGLLTHSSQGIGCVTLFGQVLLEKLKEIDKEEPSGVA